MRKKCFVDDVLFYFMCVVITLLLFVLNIRSII